MELIKEYKEELDATKARMLKAQCFSQVLPLFKDKIIKGKITGDENHINFGSRYKDTPYPWDINRINFGGKHRGKITNYNEELEHDKYLFSLYFNSISLYDSHENYGLDELNNDTVFFYDHLNTTFYIEDKHIEEFLENANKWYLEAKEKAITTRKEIQIKEAEKRLAELKSS